MKDFTLVIRNRNQEGEVVGEKTIMAHSAEEAFALADVKEFTFDGHLCNDVMRTEAGVDIKTFCNLKMSIAVGQENSPERAEYMARSKVPVGCWKCKDRSG